MTLDFEIFSYAGFQLLRFALPKYEQLVGQLLREMETGRQNFTFSHKINGRWENSYLPIEQVPSVRSVIQPARDVVVEQFGKRLVVLYEVPEGFSTPPFWFNVAKPGELTGVHDHARQASVSGVFYLQLPSRSGALFFRANGEDDLLLKPVVGTVLLFPSGLRHGVQENCSCKDRISLAFNLFTFPLQVTNV